MCFAICNMLRLMVVVGMGMGMGAPVARIGSPCVTIRPYRRF
jgi:hypothetical protein